MGAHERLINGLASGEGVIHAVRDAVIRDDGDEPKTIDAGVDDKRLLAVEPEYARVLVLGSRQGSILSQTLRAAWDGGILATLTKHDAERATDAHISVLGHITTAELVTALSETERASGFANRILWVHVHRSKLLPFGGELSADEARDLAELLVEALARARRVDRVGWSPAARQLWERHYPQLTAERFGLVGAITSRAEAQTLRLALIYALLDLDLEQPQLEPDHIEAALALWDYCARSVNHIFGTALGDPVADAILAASSRYPEGVTRTEIRDLLGRHASATQIEQALNVLNEHQLMHMTKEQTGGRPAERWCRTSHHPRSQG